MEVLVTQISGRLKHYFISAEIFVSGDSKFIGGKIKMFWYHRRRENGLPILSRILPRLLLWLADPKSAMWNRHFTIDTDDFEWQDVREYSNNLRYKYANVLLTFDLGSKHICVKIITWINGFIKEAHTLGFSHSLAKLGIPDFGPISVVNDGWYAEKAWTAKSRLLS